MKSPAFLAAATSAIRRLAGGTSTRIAGVAGVVGRGMSKQRERLQTVLGGIDVTTRRVMGIAALAVAVISACLVLVILLASGRPSRAGGSGQALAAGTSPSSSGVPASGPALASMLLVPGAGETALPLALEPKARYTEADAAAVSPDLGEVDISELTRRRKAELEAIFAAVD
ncbi:MAG: hypothetical protein CVV51_12170 [Spirochaetae bacterium HGW-Spirochaetae-7]|jgi:hypothetical protein|nr:MAG: hypothetical protein CVV51_12170 [Spirochaetae bacterium HGW-Spirochaetae-7]